MSVLFENGAYRLALTQAGRRIELNGGDLSLALLAALDTTTGADETLELLEPELRGDGTIVVERRSTLWERAWLELRCLDGAVEVHTCVRGRGVNQVHHLERDALQRRPRQVGRGRAARQPE